MLVPARRSRRRGIAGANVMDRAEVEHNGGAVPVGTPKL